MRRTSKALGAFLLACCLLFAAGVARLFVLRFKAGDMYPPYSSLRSDPLGAKVFYESLALLPNVRVSRNFENFLDGQKKTPSGTTLFVLGILPSNFALLDASGWGALRTMAREGTRVVLALAPEARAGDAEKQKEGSSCEDESDCCAEEEFVPANLGFKVARFTAGTNLHAGLKAAAPGLPKRLAWHGALAFEDLSSGWRAVYSCRDLPVVIESRVGRGSIVFAADSFYFSNEAMGFERQSDLLGWFAGGSSEVVFDEFHFGLAETPGLAKFVDRYRLHGFVAGLLLLGILFLWRQSAVFLRAFREDPVPDELVAGLDSLGGLTGLLSRRIPRNRLLFECVRAWNRSPGKGSLCRALPAPAIPDAPMKDEQIVGEYQRLRALVNARKTGRKEDDGTAGTA